MGVSKYDPAITKTYVGKLLHKRWLTMRSRPCSPEFLDYPTYFKWAIENGFEEGATIYRRDKSKPYSKENCYCVLHENKTHIYSGGSWEKEFISRWNKAVNPLRIASGLEPFKEEAGK